MVDPIEFPRSSSPLAIRRTVQSRPPPVGMEPAAIVKDGADPRGRNDVVLKGGSK